MTEDGLKRLEWYSRRGLWMKLIGNRIDYWWVRLEIHIGPDLVAEAKKERELLHETLRAVEQLEQAMCYMEDRYNADFNTPASDDGAVGSASFDGDPSEELHESINYLADHMEYVLSRRVALGILNEQCDLGR